MESLFPKNKKLIFGMVHCLPLPNTIGFCNDMEKIYSKAKSDALTLKEAGVDGIIVENTLDAPFREKMDKEQLVALAAITRCVVETVDVPVGVSASFNDAESAIAIAVATGAKFVRSAVFVDSVYVTGFGLMNPSCKEVLNQRYLQNAFDIKVLADVQVKHSYMFKETVPIEESAKIAVENGADGIIVTGISTGLETPIDVVKRVKEVVNVPVIIGSGFNKNNCEQQLEIADGAIVGSALKINNDITNPVDYDLTKTLVDNVRNVF